jgi:hypothetical protein
MATDPARDLDPFALGAEADIIALQQRTLRKTVIYLIAGAAADRLAGVRQSRFDGLSRHETRP